MKTTLEVYTSSDDALLLWSVDRLDDGVQGFAVERELDRGGEVETDWLDNFAPPGPDSHQEGRHHRSDERPFRSFTWTDHFVNTGDTVRYRAVPVFGDGPRMSAASAWTKRKTLGSPEGSKYSAFFNRGFVISQFMSRYLDEHFPGVDRETALERFKDEISEDEEHRLRAYLSGEVRTKLLSLLDEVRRSDDHVYAALFELGDDQLVDALAAIGPRAHVVLANGSIQKKEGETSAQARTRDENKEARALLRSKGVDVEEGRRFVSPGALAHNKFLVVTDTSERPRRAWTGSTNWTTTGLCTQLNNALLVDDSDVATAYLAQWRLLRDAGSGHPGSLALGNGNPAAIAGTGNVRASVHFTRARGRVDLKALAEIVQGAKEGVLFLMFIPGASGVLADVRKLQADKPELLVRGVVSDLPKGREDEKTGDHTTVRVTLVGAPTRALARTRTFDVVQPQGRRHPTAWWAAETTREQFRNSIGFAIIHSKVLVVDPFSDDPVVVTGSHNFSISASEKNDENFIVVRGDRDLAEAYAAHIQSAWRHYASRLGNPYPQLFGPAYLRALLDDQKKEAAFWRLAGAS